MEDVALTWALAALTILQFVGLVGRWTKSREVEAATVARDLVDLETGVDRRFAAEKADGDRTFELLKDDITQRQAAARERHDTDVRRLEDEVSGLRKRVHDLADMLNVHAPKIAVLDNRLSTLEHRK